MSKFLINVKVKDGNYVNAKLIKTGLFNRKTYDLKDEETLYKDLKDGKVKFVPSLNKRNLVISDKDDVIKYAIKTKDIKKENNIKKIIAGAAFISGIGIASVLAKPDKESIDYSSYEHQVAEQINEDKNINNSSDILLSSVELSEIDNTDNIISKETTTLETTKEEITSVIIPEASKEETTSVITPEVKNDIKSFQFTYEDRSDSLKDMVTEKYGDYINKYSEAYGIDANLITAILCQENPYNKRNETDFGGYGVMAIEAINDNTQLSAFNYDTNSTETITISTDKCRDNEEYSIKVGTMIFSFCYNYIQNKNVDNKYSKEDEIILSIFAYNKGIGTVKKAMNSCNNLNECINYIKEQNLGDSLYLEHVFSRIKDGDAITLKDKDGIEQSIILDNTNVNTFKK